MLGFDSLYRNDYHDEELACISANQWPMVERDQRISEVVSREQPGAPQLDSEARALHKIDPSWELMASADI
jgi:hypothetical protein